MGYASGDDPVLTIRDLTISFPERGGRQEAVRRLNLSLAPGQIIGLAGESGSGKTASALAMIGLLPSKARASGSIVCCGHEIVGASEKKLRQLRGRVVSMVFQETVAALNPVLRIGDQLMMAARAHGARSRADAQQRARQALDEVQLHDHERIVRAYADELSGGMCQRVMIAMALTCGSQVLIADEPTTALDVSVQKEILSLLRIVVEARKLGLIMISHDLAVLGDICDELTVMYQGEVIETGSTGRVLGNPHHPYTHGLIASLPRLRGKKRSLPEFVGGESADTPDQGCRFRPRCRWAIDRCELHPDLTPVADDGGSVRCWRGVELASIGFEKKQANGLLSADLPS